MKIADMVVRLEPHMGIQRTDAGPIEVELPQKRIFVNGKALGYSPDAPGSHISLVGRRLPPAVVAHIKAEVDRLRGATSPKIVQSNTLEDANFELREVSAGKPPASRVEDLV